MSFSCDVNVLLYASDVAGAFPVRGKRVKDAHLVALLKQHGIRTLYTRDTDLRKFPFLDVRDPFARLPG